MAPPCGTTSAGPTTARPSTPGGCRWRAVRPRRSRRPSRTACPASGTRTYSVGPTRIRRRSGCGCVDRGERAGSGRPSRASDLGSSRLAIGRRRLVCGGRGMGGTMIQGSSARPAWLLAAFVGVALLAVAAPAAANVPLTRVSADPFTNNTSQHATEVEPDTFAFGSTVLATYQVGRFFDGGASDIGYARSSDGGATWDTSSFLPGLTFNAGEFSGPDSPYERVSDPSVAYDAKHGIWMISSIPLLPSRSVPTIFVSRSTTAP